jgi:TPR repeat protein
VAKDEVEAARWFGHAAEQGYAEAQFQLGVRYELGGEVRQDAAAAAECYRKAANQGHARAQCSLAGCYGRGLGVTKDYVEAHKWLSLSAAQGVKESLTALPLLEGMMTREQLAEARTRASEFKPPGGPLPQARVNDAAGKPPSDLLAKAEAGDVKAQNELGEVFQLGKQGVTRNPVAAVQWFRQAAEQNLAAAQSNLGVCYERGVGVTKDEVEAYKWNLLATAQGDSKGKRNASMLELLLSREQIAEGKQRAQTWLEQRKQDSSKRTGPGPRNDKLRFEKFTDNVGKP